MLAAEDHPSTFWTKRVQITRPISYGLNAMRWFQEMKETTTLLAIVERHAFIVADRSLLQPNQDFVATQSRGSEGRIVGSGFDSAGLVRLIVFVDGCGQAFGFHPGS